jgi:hypothetical protein
MARHTPWHRIRRRLAPDDDARAACGRNDDTLAAGTPAGAQPSSMRMWSSRSPIFIPPTIQPGVSLPSAPPAFQPLDRAPRHGWRRRGLVC